MCIRVLIVDDHKILREGVRILLEKQPDVEVVAEAGDGESALLLVDRHLPDVVLMDLNMPEMNGLDATRLIVSQFPAIRVLIMSMLPDKGHVLEAVRAGAKGYITKSSVSGDELAMAVRAVAAGRSYFSEPIIELLVNDCIEDHRHDMEVGSYPITPRERDILRHITDGKNAKEIAFALNVSPKTVDAHRQRIMKKLKIRTVAELTKFAIREGITTVE